MATLKELQREWYRINAPLGKQLGYPECCIREFCNQPPEYLRSNYRTADDMIRYRAGQINNKFTGFIPCLSHARMILTKKIQLKDLIKNRDKSLPPFPLVPHYEK